MRGNRGRQAPRRTGPSEGGTAFPLRVWEGGREMAEIQWNKDVDAVLKKAEAEKKLALLDFTAAPA